MSPAKAAPAVRFEATPYAIDGSTILRLPERASNQLPLAYAVSEPCGPWGVSLG
jgi:hypothetical protein